MRKICWTLASIGALALLPGMSFLACSSPGDDCAENYTCTGPGGPGGGGGNGPGDACVPGPDGTGADLTDECGIFVALSGDDMNGGTTGAPVASIARAIDLAAAGEAKRVYACAEEFQEAVSVPAGISIYGGLDCASGSWKYIGDMTKTKVLPDADLVPLTLLGGGETTRVADIEARAADSSIPGGSSVAAIVDGATAELIRVDLIAGAGGDGDKGATPSDLVGPMLPDDPAVRGNNGANACSAAGADNAGGEAKINDLCNVSIGGAGGVGSIASGMSGSDGVPAPDPNPDGWGVGGVGATATPCKTGESGLNGNDGMPGMGAMALGTLGATGIIGAAGGDGMPGSPGQGGGGGGGAKGKVNCGGASGGGGGAGGCGGGGGKGGQAGGSSIALISINATLTLTSVNLFTASRVPYAATL